jgi:hypothetical protein
VWAALTDPAALAGWVMPVEGFAGVISALMHRGGWRRMAANRLPSYLGVRR